MLHIGVRHISIMVMYAVTVHVTWSMLLWFGSSAQNTTALHTLTRIGSPRLIAAMLTGAAALAVIGMISRSAWAALLLLPQQILLLMTASGAIEATWIAEFADGVSRARDFIGADQAVPLC